MKFPVFSSKPLLVKIGSQFNIRDANASREGAFKELLLLEKHLSMEQCRECCHKHLFTAVAYLEEARTLTHGDPEDISMAHTLEATEPSYATSAETIREVRKRLAERLGYSFEIP